MGPRWVHSVGIRHFSRRGEQRCELDDRPSRARQRPGRLSFDEVRKMGELVTSTDHRHMSIRALALFAQRTNQVFAHPVTWSRLIKERGWRRPRLRVYPIKPKVGVRASRPNEYWHIDASVIRLIDGTRVYLHAAIDNFSRRILAWRVEQRLNPLNTFHVLSDAASNLRGESSANVVMDAGVENVNGTVNQLRTAPSRPRPGGRDVFELAHRSVVGVAEAPMALPSPSGRHRDRQGPRRLLRPTAQRGHAALGIQWPHSRRDLLRQKRRSRGGPRDRADRGPSQTAQGQSGGVVSELSSFTAPRGAARRGSVVTGASREQPRVAEGPRRRAKVTFAHQSSKCSASQHGYKWATGRPNAKRPDFQSSLFWLSIGTPDWIRTNDRRIRSPMLYPAELRALGPALSIRTRRPCRIPPVKQLLRAKGHELAPPARWLHGQELLVGARQRNRKRPLVGARQTAGAHLATERTCCQPAAIQSFSVQSSLNRPARIKK